MQPKIFGIGLNKTGTSTLESALRVLGYAVTGPNKGYVPQIMRGRIGAALALTEEYDAFQDWPWPLLVEPLFARFGTDARYILTVRKNADTWLRSVKNHYLQMQPRKIVRPKFTVYGSRYPFGFEREYLRYYEAHNRRVREFFARHGAEHALLEVCWETGDGWSELCGFLGRDIPGAPFPHTNPTAARRWRRGRQYINAIAAHVFARAQGRRVTDHIFSGPL